MTQQEIIDYLATLDDSQIIPDGSQGWPDLTESDLLKIAGHYKKGVHDPIWLQIQEPGLGGLPYTRDQMMRVIRFCELDVKRRQGEI